MKFGFFNLSRLFLPAGLQLAIAEARLPADSAIGERIAVASAAGEPLPTIQVLPIGRIKSKRDGREWLIRDAAHAQAIVTASIAAAEPADIPADYDHQLMFAAKDGVGGTAKASGWLSNMRVEGGFIVADPNWTDAAAAMIRAKEYRYISPVFTFSGANREISRVLNVALTNFPAITELAAVASVDTGDTMDLTKLAACFGLPATATIDEIIAAAQAERGRFAAAAGLKTDASADEIATAMTAAKTGAVDPTKYAPMSELVSVRNELKVLQDKSATDAATAAVDSAIAGGKVTPASREWALDLATKHPASFATFVGNAPVIGAVAAASAAGGKPPETVADLTPEQRALCAATGTKPETFLATLKEEAAHGRA